MPPFLTLSEGHPPDQSTLPANKLWRSLQIGAGIGTAPREGESKILIQGEPNHNIIEELRPLEGEIIIDKPGKGNDTESLLYSAGSFYATSLELILRTKGIRNLVLTGVTTDVCVHTTMREANDRGFECVLLEDCCAATSEDNHNIAIKMIHMQGGVFGVTSTSDKLIKTLNEVFSEDEPTRAPPGHLILAVNGTLMRGLGLNQNMIDAGTVTPFPF
jgi:nicotinamidase-related amidase